VIPFELTPEHFAVLGRITATFATLEHLVHYNIGFFLDSDPWIGQIVCARLGFPRAFDALVRYRTTDQEVIAALQSSLKTASDAAEARNQLVHSRWYTDFVGHAANTATRVKVGIRRGAGVQEKTETLEMTELQSIADRLEAAVYEMSSLWEKLARAGLLKGVKFLN